MVFLENEDANKKEGDYPVDKEFVVILLVLASPLILVYVVVILVVVAIFFLIEWIKKKCDMQ